MHGPAIDERRRAPALVFMASIATVGACGGGAPTSPAAPKPSTGERQEAVGEQPAVHRAQGSGAGALVATDCPAGTAAHGAICIDASEAVRDCSEGLRPEGSPCDAPRARSSCPAAPGDLMGAMRCEKELRAQRSAPPPPPAELDPNAVEGTLATAAAGTRGCSRPGSPSGLAPFVVVFATTGRATSATVSGPVFPGTAMGGCIAAALRGASIPPFAAGPVRVIGTIEID